MSSSERTANPERDYEHEIYKQIGPEVATAERKLKYGTHDYCDVFNHHAKKSDNHDPLDQRISRAIDAQDWLSR